MSYNNPYYTSIKNCRYLKELGTGNFGRAHLFQNTETKEKFVVKEFFNITNKSNYITSSAQKEMNNFNKVNLKLRKNGLPYIGKKAICTIDFNIFFDRDSENYHSKVLVMPYLEPCSEEKLTSKIKKWLKNMAKYEFYMGDPKEDNFSYIEGNIDDKGIIKKIKSLMVIDYGFFGHKSDLTEEDKNYIANAPIDYQRFFEYDENIDLAKKYFSLPENSDSDMYKFSSMDHISLSLPREHDNHHNDITNDDGCHNLLTLDAFENSDHSYSDCIINKLSVDDLNDNETEPFIIRTINAIESDINDSKSSSPISHNNSCFFNCFKAKRDQPLCQTQSHEEGIFSFLLSKFNFC